MSAEDNSILAERKAGDLTVVLQWENIDGIDHFMVSASDANASGDLFPKDRAEAVAMYYHPYVYGFDRHAMLVSEA